MKKAWFIALLIVSIISIGGCKKGVTAKFADDLTWDQTKQEYVFEKGAKLTFWADNDEYANKIVELWNARYPSVPLKYEHVGSTDTPNKMKLDGPAGLGGDVFYIPHNSVVDLRIAGVLFQLADRDRDYIANLMQDSATAVTLYKGNMYAIPSSVENIAFVYNKQILAALPALPSAIKGGSKNLLEQVESGHIYMEELFAGVAKWKNSFSGTGVVIPYLSDRIETKEDDTHTLLAWQLYDAYHNYPFLTRNGYRVFGPNNDDPSKFDIDQKSVTDSIAAVTGDWYGNKDSSRLFPGLATIKDIGWDQGPARFQKGQLAMTISGPWVMGDIKTNMKAWAETGKFGVTAETKVSDLFGVVKLPSFSNGVQPTTFSGVQVMGMNVYTQYPNAAMNLMRFLVSEDVMKAVYDPLGKIPAVKNSSLVPGLDSDPISLGFLSQAAFSHAMPVIQEGNYMWDPLRDVWTNIFDEKMSISDAQAKSLADYQKILSNAGK